MNNYFPHDSNSRNSDKLLPVRMKYGAEGYGIYFMILERLRDEKNYMSVKDYNMLAFDLRVDTSKLKSVVEEFGLFAFTEDGECFYSEGFNKRMEIMDEKSKKKSEAGKKGAAKRWQKDSSAIAEPLTKDSTANAVAKEKNSNKTKLNKTKLNKNKESSSGNSELAKLKDFYVQNFGMMYPLTYDDLQHSLTDYGFDLSMEAMIRAVRQQKSFNTALNILKYWESNGIKTLEDAMAESAAFERKKPQKKYGQSKTVKPAPKWSNPQDNKDRKYMTDEEVEALISGLEDT